MVSAELGRLHERELFLERELQAAQDNPDLDSARLDDEALTRLLGEETARVLNAARESAHEIREKAEQSAARMLLEASDEASRMREEAEIEASRRRTDAAGDAEAELSMAKQQGREMVNEARAYRERVLSELARRRELAREQIEQLIHGRDRLMQAFERARLVAVDVVAEMQPLGEPDEYVNLQPSTGPVPVMVARQDVDALAAAASAVAAEVEAAEVEAPEVEAPETAETETAGTAVVEIEGVEIEVAEVETDASEIEVAEIHDAGVAAHAEPRADGDDEVEVGGDAAIIQIHDAIRNDAALDAGADAGLADAQPDADAPDAAVEATDVADEAAASDRDEDRRDDSERDDSQRDDDVVVDLFARLRANATVNAELSDDTQYSDDTELSDDAPDHVDLTAADEQREPDAGNESIIAEPLIVLADPPEPLAHDVADDDVADHSQGDDAEITVFEQRDADLTPLIVSSARKLKRVLADEQNEVLDALRRSDPVRNLDALLPWSSHHAERYASVISDDLLLAANAGAATAEPGRVAKLRKAAGERAVNESAQKLAQSLVEPLRERLSRCISDGDGDNSAIAKKARAVYRECKTRHIDEQLDDVVRTAHGCGVLGAFELDAPVQWTPDPNHAVCADCDDNRLAGVVPAGQQFPTGHVCTPAHPGCRCILVPAGR